MRQHSFKDPSEVMVTWAGMSEKQRLAAMLVLKTDDLTDTLNPGIMTERTLRVLEATGRLNNVNAATEVQHARKAAE